MQEPNHTPGPWLFRDGVEVITIEQPAPPGVVPGIIAYVVFSHGLAKEEFERKICDASLIAAAPELLNSLCLLTTFLALDLLAAEVGGIETTPQLQQAFDTAMAAIAKAKGEKS